MADNIYTDSQMAKLGKYEDLLDTIVDNLTEDYKKNKDSRTVRLLLETVTTSTESIHKSASNKIKNEANKANEASTVLVSTLLERLSDNSQNPHRKRIMTDQDIEDAHILIEAPVDIVKGEMDTSKGWLSMEELEGKTNE